MDTPGNAPGSMLKDEGITADLSLLSALMHVQTIFCAYVSLFIYKSRFMLLFFIRSPYLVTLNQFLA